MGLLGSYLQLLCRFFCLIFNDSYDRRFYETLLFFELVFTIIKGGLPVILQRLNGSLWVIKKLQRATFLSYGVIEKDCKKMS